jgi:hypothetical protein
MHPFFDDINVENILAMSVEAPFMPKTFVPKDSVENGMKKKKATDLCELEESLIPDSKKDMVEASSFDGFESNIRVLSKAGK